MSTSGSDDKSKLYHERQSRELCALHALNNLFQEKGKFAKKNLDDICQRLSPDTYINPHRSMLGLGNYDINVIMAALDDVGYQTIWFDKRKDLATLGFEHVHGFILNVPSNVKLGFIQLPIERKHWITVRQVDNVFYSFDSKLDKPEAIGNEDELLEYLKEEIKSPEKQLLVVVEKSVSMDLLWRTDGVGDGQKDSGFSSRSGSDATQDASAACNAK